MYYNENMEYMGDLRLAEERGYRGELRILVELAGISVQEFLAGLAHVCIRKSASDELREREWKSNPIKVSTITFPLVSCPHTTPGYLKAILYLLTPLDHNPLHGSRKSSPRKHCPLSCYKVLVE